MTLDELAEDEDEVGGRSTSIGMPSPPGVRLVSVFVAR